MDCILGANIYSSILLKRVRLGKPLTSVAQETRLGWILTGQIDECNQSAIALSHSTFLNVFYSEEELETAEGIKKFWELDKIPEKPLLTVQEQVCETHFVKT